MTMKRTELLEKLQLVAPALAGKDIIPVMTHVWLTGARMLAYNDRISISCPFKSEVKGAVPGDLFIKLLKASRAENVDFSTDGRDFVVKAATAKLRLAMMDPEAFIFTMPKMKADPPPLNDAFLEGIKGCMRSVTMGTEVPEQMGVTVIPDRDSLMLYATNNATLSYAKIPFKTHGLKSRAILPALFCDQLVAMAKDEKVQLEITDKYALAYIGPLTLWGSLVEADHPMDFQKIIARHIPDNPAKKMIAIPTKLEQILEKATIITEEERSPTLFTVHGGKLDIFCRSEKYGHEYKDVVSVPDHPDVDKVSLDSKLLELGYGHFENMLITGRCAIMAKGDTYFLVASR